MNRLSKNPDDWIRPYAFAEGSPPPADERPKEAHMLRWHLQMSLPSIFESYCVVLHPFWVSNKIPVNQIRPFSEQDDVLEDHDYQKVTWKAFYESKGKEFNLESAYTSEHEFLNLFPQMNNEMSPAQGLMDKT